MSNLPPWSPGESPSRTQDPPSTQKGFESKNGPQKEPWYRWYLFLISADCTEKMDGTDQRDISFHWLNINLWLISHPTDTFCCGITSSTRFTWGDFKLQFLQIIYPSLMWDSILIWWLTNAANAVVAQTIWRRITLILWGENMFYLYDVKSQRCGF